MTQKDKVKELVGRSLDSYHTKALQQMDRIEKKNKEQNHKINILTNELDNDYLTKTEESSVISLDHSKEGMVYIDELEGNTLVNYCTDGAKELTLNGDIDVEGTNVTLTEGVDSGLVDVVCEGNTLVNLFSGKISDLYGGSYRKEEDGYITLVKKTYGDCIHLKTDMYKPNTDYTLIVDVKENTLSSTANLLTDSRTYVKSTDGYIGAGKTGIFKIKFTTIDDFSTTTNNLRWGFYLSYAQLDEITRGDITLKFVLLEGDWTNKEIPSYFKGMKSVGECENNKFEILSRNSNNEIVGNGIIGDLLVDYNGNIANGGSADNYFSSDIFEEIEPNTQYYFWHSKDGIITNNGQFIYFYDENKHLINGRQHPCIQFVSYSNARYFKMMVNRDTTTDIKFYVSKKNVTPTVIDSKTKLNKKEISLNEPLRGLPNGVKDRFVKQGGKWYVERRLYGLTLNGGENEKWNMGFTNFGTPIFTWNGTGINICRTESYYSVLSDRFIYAKQYSQTAENHKCIYVYNNQGLDDSIRIQYPSNSVEEFRNYLSNNPIKVIVQLEVPTYEEITDIELTTYLDTTHISNNSTIPCNMKIINSGYNAIIKPSTLYTVALDTNKSGTIGINLGGAKVTTTNNVATITTPATLADDSLRLYGKGIKASKVRLLEGDKTNWIPSHFEGMKSSFEDKLQEDGTFKMEILSEGKNKLNGYNFARSIFNSVKNSVLNTENKTIKYNANNINDIIFRPIKFKKNTRYTIILKGFNDNTNIQATNIKAVYTDGSFGYINNFVNNETVFVSSEGKTLSHIVGNWSTMATTLYYDECGIFEGVNVLFEPYKYHNKIQFSSIEPLRGIGDVKDRFVFKDGKLMIERNTIKIVLNGSEAWGIYPNQINRPLKSKCYYMVGYDKFDISDNNSVCDIFSNVEHCYNSADINCFSDYHTAPNKYFTSFCNTLEEFKEYLKNNNATLVGKIKKPTYEEIPFELQKIILEGYENGTLFFDTNIPPTVTTTYAGETPIVKATKLNKTEVLNNTNDINDNIVPYLMDMDYRVVCLQLEGGIENVSMARLFGGTYEMLQRDILSKRYSKEEYLYRLDTYLSANKITEDEYNKLGDMLNE